MRIPLLVATVTATLVTGIGSLALGLGVALAAVPTGSPFGPPQANAKPPPGTWTPSPSAGSDVSVIKGVTNGTCDVPGTPEAPVDGFNAVLTGPGAFAPNLGTGRPDGPVIVSTSDMGFSTTNPIPFTFRTHFRNLAQELGTPLLPGDYVVTFRCVNQFDGVVYQTFSATIRFTGGPPATAYVVTNPPPTTSPPSPGSSPSPTPTTGVASSGGTATGGTGTGFGSGGALVTTIAIAGLAVSALGAALWLAARRRRAG
ncbi:MAG: hypothetical protein ACRDRP_23385 [Pseudonocardiaceae bacterium]